MFDYKIRTGVMLIAALTMILFMWSDNLNASGKNLMPQKTAKWYKYEPEVVTLKGELLSKSAYGPPNYGENPRTDKKVKYYVLKLETPINVKGDPKSEVNTDTYENISEIQMVLIEGITAKEDMKSMEDKVNKKVTVQGMLFQAITGHHYTKVLIKVRHIELIGK